MIQINQTHPVFWEEGGGGAKQGVDPNEAVEVGRNRREKLKAASEWGGGMGSQKQGVDPVSRDCE